VDNSPCAPNFRKTDIADYHWYSTIPGSYEYWIGFVRRFATDPGWIFGNNPIRKGDESLIVSEFGVWGLPSLKKIMRGYGGEPWWFSKGCGSGIPKGAEERFNSWNLREIWKDWEKFAVFLTVASIPRLKFMIEK